MVARGTDGPDVAVGQSWDVLARDLLAAHGSWTVHSVFQQALNLVSPDGSLLGVVRAEGANGPATLTLASTPGAQPLDQSVAQGMTAQVRAGTLTIADRLTIDLRTALPWSPPAIQLALPADEVAERIVFVRSRAAALAPREGFGPLLSDSATGPLDLTLLRAGAIIDRLVTAIRRQYWEDVPAPARSLSGLGPGLTPSGDDVLAGLALGMWAGLGELPAPLADALRAAVEGRTTDLAVARVRHAVDGRPDEPTHRLLAAMVSGPPDDLEAAVAGLVAYGHSSGADTIVGINRGLRLGVAHLLEQGL